MMIRRIAALAALTGLTVIPLTLPATAATAAPRTRPAPAWNTPGRSYTVQTGDTLASIAARYGLTWQQLAAANPQLADPNIIHTGQVLSLSRPASAQRSVRTNPGGRNITPTPSAGSFQACVITRESGGNPHAVNPSSGAGGLYQFLPSTWAALGLSGLPEDASVAEQNQAFAEAYARWGTSPWAPYDGC